MQALPRALVNKYARAYAGKKVGFSAKEITEYFTKYSNLVRPYDHYGINPTREQLFIESLYALPAKLQYYSLNDLTWFEHPSKYEYPNSELREQLRSELHNIISFSPIGLGFSKIRETAFREDWITCYSRLANGNVPASITASRTMLETLLSTIISECSEIPDRSDLGKLLKQAESCVGFNKGTQQEEHQIFSGLTSIINGIATISNAAGDRHGTAGGKSINDPYFAELCINAAGTLGLAFIEMHLFNKCNNT